MCIIPNWVAIAMEPDLAGSGYEVMWNDTIWLYYGMLYGFV